jgi:ABC-type dipeptide/oligopeptide/nickel transport system ATPase component
LVVDALGGLESGRKLLERLGLPDRLLHLSMEDLSAGEAQLVSLLIRLQQKPTLVFLDEPHLSSDSSDGPRLAETLLGERKLGCAFLITTSSLQVVQAYSTRTAHIYRGRTLEIGPTEALLARPLHPMTAAVVSGAARYPKRELEQGCFYFDECPRRRRGDCDVREPALAYGSSGSIEERHLVACFYPLSPPTPGEQETAVTPPTPGVHETWIPGGDAERDSEP